MLKKLIKTVATVWIIVMVLIIGTRGYYNSVVKKPLKNVNEAKLKITIKRGDTLSGVINRLNSEGKLNNSLLIRLYIKMNKIQFSLNQGDVEINKDDSLEKILTTLKEYKGLPVNVARVMIPEGRTVEDIAALLDKSGVITKEKFLESCKKYELPPYIKKDTKRKYALEGYLFPDTYDFTKGSDGKVIIDLMIRNFENRLNEVRSGSEKSLSDEDIDKIITLASIIEKEVQIAEERVLVSSVFANRLKLGMPLQSDPTVQYALGEHKEKLTLDDYKINSPYNTYVVNGVPLGPISNPGKASIEAALNPENTKLLYFCARNDGSHEFNESFEKHTAAVRKYQSN